jgi:hypothetical protein
VQNIEIELNLYFALLISNSKVAFLKQQVPGLKTRTGMAGVLIIFFSERFFYDHFNWSDRDSMRPLMASELAERVLSRKFSTFNQDLQ